MVCRGRPLPGAARNRKIPPRNRPRGLGGQGGQERLSCDPGRPHRSADKGRAGGTAGRQNPLLRQSSTVDRRRNRLSADRTGGAQTCSSNPSTPATKKAPWSWLQTVASQNGATSLETRLSQQLCWTVCCTTLWSFRSRVQAIAYADTQTWSPNTSVQTHQ